MFGRFFRKRSKKQKYSIQRLENQPFEFNGKKLSGEVFNYEDGIGEANLYQMEDEKLAIELRLTDSEVHMHVLLKFETTNDAMGFMEWIQKDMQKTKAHLQALLQ